MKARRGRLFRVARVLVLTAIILALLLIFDPDGLAGDPPSKMHPQVRELAVLGEEPPVIAALGTTQDFDGDGVIDTVRSDVDPEAARSVGEAPLMVHSVESGRTGERLIECRPGYWPSAARWYGDLDENGTLDVVFELEDGWHVFGFILMEGK